MGISLLVLISLALAGITGVGLAAQESTPDPVTDETITLIELAPGVTAKVLAEALSVLATDQTVYLARFVFQPEAENFPHRHPGKVVLGVVCGSFGWTLHEGTAYVVGGAAAGAMGPMEDRVKVASSTDVILEPGDAIFDDEEVIHTARRWRHGGRRARNPRSDHWG